MGRLFQHSKVFDVQKSASEVKEFFAFNGIISGLVVPPLGAVRQVRAAIAFKFRGKCSVDDGA
jgi:hypothetical protein